MPRTPQTAASGEIDGRLAPGAEGPLVVESFDDAVRHGLRRRTDAAIIAACVGYARGEATLRDTLRHVHSVAAFLSVVRLLGWRSQSMYDDR